MKKTALVSTLVLSIALRGQTSAETLPVHTYICCGESMAARYLYGNSAAMFTKDATWVFSDVGTLDQFFDVEGNPNCDDSCISHPVHSLGGVRAVATFTSVRVLEGRPTLNIRSDTTCVISAMVRTDGRCARPFEAIRQSFKVRVLPESRDSSESESKRRPCCK